MKPSIGRIVHYQDPGQVEPRAAVVTGTLPADVVSLEIFGAHRTDQRWLESSVPHAPGDKPTPGHWNWPPRESVPAPTGTEDTDKVGGGRRVTVKG